MRRYNKRYRNQETIPSFYLIWAKQWYRFLQEPPLGVELDKIVGVMTRRQQIEAYKQIVDRGSGDFRQAMNEAVVLAREVGNWVDWRLAKVAAYEAEPHGQEEKAKLDRLKEFVTQFGSRTQDVMYGEYEGSTAGRGVAKSFYPEREMPYLGTAYSGQASQDIGLEEEECNDRYQGKWWFESYEHEAGREPKHFKREGTFEGCLPRRQRGRSLTGPVSPLRVPLYEVSEEIIPPSRQLPPSSIEQRFLPTSTVIPESRQLPASTRETNPLGGRRRGRPPVPPVSRPIPPVSRWGYPEQEFRQRPVRTRTTNPLGERRRGRPPVPPVSRPIPPVSRWGYPEQSLSRYPRRRPNLEQEPELIKGGVAANLTVEDIARKHGLPIADILRELKIGMQVEMEHVDDPQMAREIAKDHIFEIPDYYSRLILMEQQYESEVKKKKEIRKRR